jgi:DNA-binding Lrp family transcriptional regulator
MVNAIVLMKVTRGKVNDLAEQLAAMEGVAEVYSVGGRYDLVGIIRVRSNEELADLVTKEMAKLEGIEYTETMTAFRAYSRHDLEAMFSIGFEK